MKTTKAKTEKKISGRPPTYKESVFAVSDSFIESFKGMLKAGEKVMLTFETSKGKQAQLGQLVLLKMKGYTHTSGFDGSKRKLKSFHRVKFIPSKEFKEFIKNI